MRSSNVALFFENLPILSLASICKHLPPLNLIHISIASKRWAQAVNRCGIEIESVLSVSITKDHLLIDFVFEDTSKNFFICFADPTNFRSNKAIHLESGDSWLTCHFGSSSQFEDICLQVLHLIPCLFPPNYYHITLSIGSRSPVFPIYFLSLLPRGKANFVYIHADETVDGGHLVKFLENVSVDYNFSHHKADHLILRATMRNVIRSDKILLTTGSVKIADSRFLTRNSLKKIDLFHGEYGKNVLKSEDFNAWLKCWQRRKHRHYSLKVTFDISKDQDISLEKVLEGLRAKKGRFSERDRYFLEFEREDENMENPTAIDTWDDYDISNSKGHLATVRFTGDKLIFMLWKVLPSFLDFYQRFVEPDVRLIDEMIEELEEERRGFENKLVNEEDLEEKRHLIGKIKMVTLEIEDQKNQKTSCFTRLERITQWKAANKREN